MYNFPIGVMLDSFKVSTKEAIEIASKIGAKHTDFFMYDN